MSLESDGCYKPEDYRSPLREEGVIHGGLPLVYKSETTRVTPAIYYHGRGTLDSPGDAVSVAPDKTPALSVSFAT